MLSHTDLKGVMAMMPAFTTDNGNDFTVKNTIDVNRLADGVDRMVKDGANVIATTGSFGEATNLLSGELDTLARATVEVVNKRVPVIVGCIGYHTREVIEKMRIAQDAGADGVIVGVPGYFPSTAENAIQFFKDVSGLFPNLGVLIYHNPLFHHITIPVEAFNEITKIPNVVGMKDSHRNTIQFQRQAEIVKGKISVFVNHSQYNVYKALGAAGFWAIDIWMGPEPLIRLRDAVDRGEVELARRLAIETSFNRAAAADLQWREIAHKIAVRFAGYCDPGPLRPPFIHVPDTVIERQKQRAKRWRELCTKYAKVPVV